MQKPLIALAVLVLVAAGWYYYKQSSAAPEAERHAEPALFATFLCEDGRTRFEAEFWDDDTLHLLRDGAAFRTLPRTDDAPQTFEDSEFKYVFAGEEVSVTNKTTNESFTCGQLHDPSLAPINFGDTGEGAGESQDITAAVRENMIGSWQSEDDAKYVQEFRPDNAVIDYYDGEQSMDSEWRVFIRETASSLPNTDVPYPLKDNTAYLMIAADHEALFYEVTAVTPERLN